MNRKLRIGLVGAGRMGAHHSRIVQQSAHAELAAVVDLDPLKAQLIAGSSGAGATTDFRSAFGCDAVIVATTAETHWEVAKPLLRAGVPLLIEKPLAPTVDEAEALVALSAAHNVPMMCGFVERFNAVVRTAEKLMSESGRALHFVSLRHSPAEPLVPTSVVHDLLIHDADLALKLCEGRWSGHATAALWHDGGRGVTEIADCTMTFDSGAVATLSASRMGQRKVREIRLATEDALLELDLVRRNITVYRHKSHQATIDGAGYRSDTVVDLPFVQESGEPLALQFEHFVKLVRGEIDAQAERAGLLGAHYVAARVENAGAMAPAAAG